MDEREIELMFWKLVIDESGREPGRMIRAGQIAVDNLPIHKHRATDITKSWENRGLCVTFSNGARLVLTPEGKTIDDPLAV